MTNDEKERTRREILDVLNGRQNPQSTTGSLIPPAELDRLLTLSRQRKAGLISVLPADVAEYDIARAEEQHTQRIMAKNTGEWTPEDRAFILGGVNDWMKENR